MVFVLFFVFCWNVGRGIGESCGLTDWRAPCGLEDSRSGGRAAIGDGRRELRGVVVKFDVMREG